MLDDATITDLQLSAGWNPPAGGIKTCPNPKCGGDATNMTTLASDAHYVECIECDLCGPSCGTVDAAIRAWNELPRVPAPDPADLVVTAVGPDEALETAAAALRASGNEIAARLVEEVIDRDELRLWAAFQALTGADQ